MSNRQMLAFAAQLALLVALVCGLAAAVVHFERRTRPAGAAPWCMRCPEKP